MKTLYQFMKVHYDESSSEEVKSISPAGKEKFRLPKRCVVCNNREKIETRQIPPGVDGIKMETKYKLSMPYCKKHLRQTIIYEIAVGLLVLAVAVLALWIMFTIVEPDPSDIGSWIEVFVWSLLLSPVVGLVLALLILLKKGTIDRINSGTGVWGIKLFKDHENGEIEDPYVNVGFTFHNDSFAEAFAMLNASIEPVEEQDSVAE